MKAEPSRIDIKIKIGHAEIIFEAAPGFKLDVLDHSHGINSHENRFPQKIALVFRRQTGMRETDFTAILNNIHPGFFGVGQVDR